MKTIRAFAAVEIGAEKEMVSLIEELKASPVKVKTVEPENMHLTLKFFGEIGERALRIISEDMKKFRDVGSFDISLSQVGAFPSAGKPRVIWIGIDGGGSLEELWKMMEDISEKAGVARDKRNFSPHLTIGRVRDTQNSWKLRDFIEAHKNDEFGKRHITEVKLKKSLLTPSGPIYSDLFTVKLK